MTSIVQYYASSSKKICTQVEYWHEDDLIKKEKKEAFTQRKRKATSKKRYRPTIAYMPSYFSTNILNLTQESTYA